jgi:hypothetical protein
VRKALAFLSGIAAVLLWCGVVNHAQPAQDAAKILADMRQALGGDAAIAAVHTFSVSGSEQHSIPNGPTSSAMIEWFCELPDRFVRVRRTSTPWGENVDAAGFSADVRISRRDVSSPMPPDPFANDTPAQKAERDKRVVRNLRHEFSRFAIAMIGIPAVDPLDVAYAGSQTAEGKQYDVLALRSSDGYEAQLWVDSASHLPFAIAWMDAPIVTMTSSSMVVVPHGQSPGSVTPAAPAMPPGDPTAGLPKVLHQVRFEDFRNEDGFTWPHRLVERAGDRVWATTKLGKYKLNPKIDPKRFAPK